MFRRLNEQYFDSKLEEPKVIAYRQISKNQNYEGKTQFSDGKAVAVILDSRLKHLSSCAELVLLHEMVHVKLGLVRNSNGDEHAPYQFGAEIVRLWEAGAYGGLL